MTMLRTSLRESTVIVQPIDSAMKQIIAKRSTVNAVPSPSFSSPTAEQFVIVLSFEVRAGGLIYKTFDRSSATRFTAGLGPEGGAGREGEAGKTRG